MAAISEKIVRELPVPEKGNKVHFFSGSTLQGKKAPAGFGVRVTSAGTRAFVLFHRVGGKKYLETLGRWDENAQGGTLTVRDGIVAAEKRAKAIAKGTAEDHRPERTRRLEDGDKADGLTVGEMLDQFVDRYCRKEKSLRSADQYESTFERLVKPEIGDVAMFGPDRIRRAAIVDMLDEIEDESGPAMADRTLALLRKSFNWFAARNEEFINPIVKGMREIGGNFRKRILSDDEIRDVWQALDVVENVPACYPRFVKSLLLTAARRTEAALMHSSELDGSAWTVPADRYKTGIDHLVPMSAAALALVGEKPDDVTKNSWFVFSTTKGEKGFSGFSKAKRELDAKIAELRKQASREPMPHWTLHDLRRTARSLMSRAGASSDHAERCLGHVIGGVRGVYDRHEYEAEKRATFELLAGLVDRILNPESNVVSLRGA